MQITVRDGLIVDNSVQFENIFISVTRYKQLIPNSDLELDAAGTGRVVFPDADLEVGGNITVAGTAQFANQRQVAQ